MLELKMRLVEPHEPVRDGDIWQCKKTSARYVLNGDECESFGEVTCHHVGAVRRNKGYIVRFVVVDI